MPTSEIQLFSMVCVPPNKMTALGIAGECIRSIKT